ncbi:MAG TPA: hypothetical protein VGE39_18095 [Prosthecobacter sp.]
MPDEPLWLGVLIKVGVFLAIAVAGVFIEGLFTLWMGHLGAWAQRLLTLGRRRPDPESWFSIILGWVILIVVVMFASEAFISHKLRGY